MTVKLEQYRIFKAIADTGNISRTAKQLYLSQSAVSQSLQQLESALGVRLFSRTARGVTLTAEGSVLYDYAAQALSLLEAGEERIAQSRELLKGELSIGVSSTLTKYYLLPFLRDYHQQYPHIHVRILNGTSRRVLQLLGSGQVELAFATYTPDADSFSIFPCFDTHTVFVAAPDYPCDFDRVYTLQEISEFPLILLEREASSRRFLEDCFLQRGLRLQPEIELASHNLLISLARIGLGVAGVTEELSLSEALAYRDDVFLRIQRRTEGCCSGFAYKVMHDAACGVYARGGMSALLKSSFRRLGLTNALPRSLQSRAACTPKRRACSTPGANT